MSHDLRQPLQTLTLLHDVLHGQLKDEKAAELALRAQQTLDSMSGMLDALLDINQLEAGIIQPEPVDFPINLLLDKLRPNSSTMLPPAAWAGGWCPADSSFTAIRICSSRWCVIWFQTRSATHPKVRSCLVAGATATDCASRCGTPAWALPKTRSRRIFEEYHQAAGHPEEGGLGLGLAIVQRLSQLLGHTITVRSRLGKGSVFAIEVPLVLQGPGPMRELGEGREPNAPPRRGAILVIEDDTTLRETLELTFAREGHRTSRRERAGGADARPREWVSARPRRLRLFPAGRDERLAGGCFLAGNSRFVRPFCLSDRRHQKHKFARHREAAASASPSP